MRDMDEVWVFILGFAAFIGLMVVLASQSPHRHHDAKYAKHHAHLEKLRGDPSGTIPLANRWALIDDDGSSWMLDMMSQMSDSALDSYPLSNGSGRITIPPGNWVKTTTPPVKEEIEEVDEVDVEEAAGIPLEGSAETEAEAAPAESDTASADTGDVGGGDVGGGDVGGGDMGGGGEGGGGE
jgi:hypothetical protein